MDIPGGESYPTFNANGNFFMISKQYNKMIIKGLIKIMKDIF
jgi:hypothetical protein